MRKLVIGVIAVVVIVAIIGSLGGNDGDGSGGGDGNDGGGQSEFAQGQIERIEGSSDCEELQVIFDASAGAHDRFSDEEPPNLGMMEAHTDIMSAADDQMQEVGCYD